MHFFQYIKNINSINPALPVPFTDHKSLPSLEKRNLVFRIAPPPKSGIYFYTQTIFTPKRQARSSMRTASRWWCGMAAHPGYIFLMIPLGINSAKHQKEALSSQIQLIMHRLMQIVKIMTQFMDVF